MKNITPACFYRPGLRALALGVLIAASACSSALDESSVPIDASGPGGDDAADMGDDDASAATGDDLDAAGSVDVETIGKDSDNNDEDSGVEGDETTSSEDSGSEDTSSEDTGLEEDADALPEGDDATETDTDEPTDVDASEDPGDDAGLDEDGQGGPEDAEGTEPIDGEGNDEGDSEEEEEVIDDPCPEPPPTACDDEGATRCADDATNLIETCKYVSGCLQWMASEYCEFSDGVINECTGTEDICFNGACVPDGPTGCPEPEGACEEAFCDGYTAECSVVIVEPGFPCDDGDVCTKQDACFGTECLGSAVDPLSNPYCPKDCLGADAQMECGDWASFSLTEGTPNLIDEYSCDGADSYDGWEHAFLLSPPPYAIDTPLKLTLELADPTLKGEAFADIVVLAVDDTGYQCWANQCITVGYMDETGLAEVEIESFIDDDSDPANDTQYIVLVDGRDGFTGMVRLAAGCGAQLAPEMYCTDGTDDNFNGTVDCADPDCWWMNSDSSEWSYLCAFEHSCDNGEDDDGDGALDCADDDCAGAPACQVEFVCDDGVDGDGDGLTDCDDEDCAFTPTCSMACEDAIPLSCGQVLTAQDPTMGSATFANFPCSYQGLGIPSPAYNNPHLIYHVTADPGCGARVRVSASEAMPEDAYILLDIYAMGPGCNEDQCIEIEGSSTSCNNPQTPGTAFFGDSCVQIPESLSESSWVTVIPPDDGPDPSTQLYDIEVICDCN